jgi:hypothetical protein
MITAIALEQLTCCIHGCTCQALYLAHTDRSCDCVFPEVMKLCLDHCDNIVAAVSPGGKGTAVCTGCAKGRIIVTCVDRIWQP